MLTILIIQSNFYYFIRLNKNKISFRKPLIKFIPNFFGQ